MSDDEIRWLSAAEAAERLGVKVETVYAYVSRGVLNRAREHARGFAAADVELLAVRGRRSAGAKPAPLTVVSELTELGEDHIAYRGRNAVEVARELQFEAVARLLWGADDDQAAFTAARAAVALAASVCRGLPDAAWPLDRLRVAAAVLGSSDALRYDTSKPAVIATARGLIAGMVESLPRVAARQETRRETPALCERLWPRLTAQAAQPARVQVLDLALGLCADHGLSPSTLAVRIAASQRADPYSVVQTGLAALGGSLHGGAALAAEDLLREIEAGADASAVIGKRMRSGERIAGFGHAQHTRGDPRAEALLQALHPKFGSSRGLQAALHVLDVMRSRQLPGPNIDFALAALARSAHMIHGASEGIMAIARSAGWIAHALEEYRSPSTFPWQTLYVGPRHG